MNDESSIERPETSEPRSVTIVNIKELFDSGKLTSSSFNLFPGPDTWNGFELDTFALQMIKTHDDKGN